MIRLSPSKMASAQLPRWRNAHTDQKLPSFSSFQVAALACTLGGFAQGANADVLPENRALLAFKNEQIQLVQQLLPKYTGADRQEINDWILSNRKRAQEIERATGDAGSVSLTQLDVPFRLEERAYFAANDHSPQPYWVALPRDYSPDKKYPFAVFLHGYTPAISKLSPWILDLNTLAQATAHGFIVAMPYGRRNSDFVQWGEDDVLAVKRECLRVYSVDTQRTFLAGASMGGYGAYAVGLHTPGEWTAVAPIAGRTDFYVWFKTQRADLPAWKQVLYDADDPRTLIGNGRSTPYFLQHGAEDKTVPVEHSRLFAADATRLQLPFQYQEIPDRGHEDAFQLPAMRRAFDWMSQQQPRPAPRQVTFSSGDLREAKSDWAQIDAFGDYASLARLDAKLDGSTIRVETDNVARFTLGLKEFALGQVGLEVNNQKVGNFDSAQPILWTALDAKTSKSPAQCGPFKSLMRSPFVLVYGNDRDHKDALRFAAEWSDCADGKPTIRSVEEVSGVDKRQRNIILFGTRDSNALLGEIADQLPLELRRGGYRVGSNFTKMKNGGLRMVWRSPWSDEHLVGVCSGEWWGEKLPLNHKWDLLPDYIVYKGDEKEKDDTNRAVVAGNFDGGWQIKEDTPKSQLTR